MPYDFDTPLERRSFGSLKWNSYPKDVVPMWVADMDFKVAEPITRALMQRVAHGVFGYTPPPDSLRESIVSWIQRRHDWAIQPDSIVFLPGLVCGLNLVCRAFGQRGDNALMLTPIYPPFLSAPESNKMTTQTVMLARKDINGFVRYEIDFDSVEKTINSRTRVLLLCHPHNPIGQEFSTADLRQLSELCIRHNMVLCSDEVHCELMLGSKHTPLALISPEIADKTITLMAPSKPFNLPGLGFGFAIVPNQQLRSQFLKAQEGITPLMNLMGLVAAEAAYSESEEWLKELINYLISNRDFVTNFVRENMPDIKSTNPMATYLSWFDCSALKISGTPFELFLNKAKVATVDGSTFGPGGKGFVRLNFACPRAQLTEALTRMADAIHTYKVT